VNIAEVVPPTDPLKCNSERDKMVVVNIAEGHSATVG